ncbi:MAG: hypothetical protein QXK74_02200 [Candidatus Nitrosocaldaceae archaeon]
MGLRLVAFILVTFLSFIILMIGTVLNELISPYKINFFYTHWIVGRLTGLWDYDFIVDTALVSLCIGLLAVLWVHRRLA